MKVTGTNRIPLRLVLTLVPALAVLPAPALGQDLQPRIDQLKALVAQQDSEIAQITQDLKAVRDRHPQQVTAYNTLFLAGQTQQSMVNGYLPISTTLPKIFEVVQISGKNMIVHGANLQIRNGSNASAAANGLGNLILGFNAKEGTEERTGSHNIVMGDLHSYTGSNGFVGGRRNRIQSLYSAVLAGYSNEATADYSIVGAGSQNRTTREAAVILTGRGGWATNPRGLIGTGTQNVVQGDNGNVILTGTQNWMHGTQNIAATGFGNTFNQYNVRSVMASSVKFFGGANYGFYTEHNW